MHFQYLLDSAYKNGLTLNPRLERKCVDGVCGMYATGTIQSGESLASFPHSNLIKVDDRLYPQDTSNSARLIHSAAKEYVKGTASDFHYVFSVFDSLEEIKSYSSYFADEEDLSRFKKLGQGLYREIQSQNEKNKRLIQALYEFDPSVDPDIYAMVTLNFGSRAMGVNGFVPVVDCFNHSDEKGANIDSRGETVSLSAKVDYQAGEQVYTTYGTLDLLTHGINYNYFDSQNIHFIQLEKRFRFTAKTEKEVEMLKQLASRFRLSIQPFAHGYIYSFQEREAYFSETQPSSQIIEIARSMAEHSPFKLSPKEILLGFLKQLDSENTVESCSKKLLPKRYGRFYRLLKKEKQMIRENLNWVTQNM